jgi:hypothetical protein
MRRVVGGAPPPLHDPVRAVRIGAAHPVRTPRAAAIQGCAQVVELLVGDPAIQSQRRLHGRPTARVGRHLRHFNRHRAGATLPPVQPHHDGRAAFGYQRQPEGFRSQRRTARQGTLAGERQLQRPLIGIQRTSGEGVEPEVDAAGFRRGALRTHTDGRVHFRQDHRLEHLSCDVDQGHDDAGHRQLRDRHDPMGQAHGCTSDI